MISSSALGYKFIIFLPLLSVCRLKGLNLVILLDFKEGLKIFLLFINTIILKFRHFSCNKRSWVIFTIDLIYKSPYHLPTDLEFDGSFLSLTSFSFLFLVFSLSLTKCPWPLSESEFSKTGLCLPLAIWLSVGFIYPLTSLWDQFFYNFHRWPTSEYPCSDFGRKVKSSQSEIADLSSHLCDPTSASLLPIPLLFLFFLTHLFLWGFLNNFFDSSAFAVLWFSELVSVSIL